MTRPRRRRARIIDNIDAISALRAGEEITYSPTAHQALIGAIYFGDVDHDPLQPKAIERAQILLRDWAGRS